MTDVMHWGSLLFREFETIPASGTLPESGFTSIRPFGVGIAGSETFVEPEHAYCAVAERSAKPASESTRPIAKAFGKSALGDPVQPCYQWVIKTNVSSGCYGSQSRVEFAFGKYYSVDLPMIYSPYTVSLTFRLQSFLAVQPSC